MFGGLGYYAYLCNVKTNMCGTDAAASSAAIFVFGPQRNKAIRGTGLGSGNAPVVFAHIDHDSPSGRVICLMSEQYVIMGKNRKPYTEEELVEIVSRYDSLTEFRKKERSVYWVIQKRGMIDKLCGHMKRSHRNRWTDEDLAEVASRYDTLKEFADKEKSAYATICKRGLGDKMFAHMKLGHARRSSKEKLAAIAVKYDNLAEFVEKEYKTYAVMSKRGYVDELCAHMKRGHRGSFSDEELSEIALRYETLQDFKKNDYSALVTIRSRGLFDKLCGHLEFGHARRRSDEELAEIASHYDNVKEFLEKEKNIYTVISERGLLKKLCGHMKHAANLTKRKIYAFTFSDGYAYIGLTQDVERRYSEHMTGKRKKTPVHNHIRKTGATFEFAVLTDWLDVDVAGKIEDDYIKQYAAEGWKMMNRTGGGSLGGPHGRFYRCIVDKHLSNIAACSTRSELSHKYPTTYRWLVKNRRLDEFFPK